MIHRKRLLWQIFPSFLLVIVIALTAVTVYSTRAMEQFYLVQTRSELESRAQLVIPQINRLLNTPDSGAIQALVGRAGRASSTRITVILTTGEVVGDSDKRPEQMENHADRPEIAAAIQGSSGSSIRYSSTLQKRMMYVALPLINTDGTTRAVVRTSFPISEVDDALTGIRWRVLAGGIIAAALAGLLSLWVARRISRPIEEIKNGAARFAAGDLNEPLPIPDSAELADLARTMNQMAAEIESRIQQAVSGRKEIESILSSMVEGVIAVDMDEKVIRINDAAGRIVSATIADATGRNLHELIRSTQFHRLFEETLQGGTTTETDISLFGLEEVTIYTRCAPLRDARDEQVGVLVVMQDVTQLRRLEHMRRDFAANVSHEIKTPLTAIKGFVETLRHTEVDDPGEAERFLEIIEKHVNRLSAIIDDLMQLSRIEQDSLGEEIFLRDCRLDALLKNAALLCQESAVARQVTIDIHCQDDLTIAADAPLLEQAVLNLMDNAIKYSAGGGTITVTARETDTATRIAVADNGPGIPQKHIPRLFERFYRVDKARSRRIGGTGLGLAIVKHIIQAHGGDIEAASEIGKGSVFTIVLPRK